MSRSQPLLSVLRGEIPSRRPVWLMRQAGRYLDEYKMVRARVGSFLDLCYDPVLASEVTLQPLRRFDLDAAIVFSDILVVAHALGAKLEFREGEGPVLSAVRGSVDLRELSAVADLEQLSPVFETVRRVRANITAEQSLIGFCGGPWTVASYMIEGGSVDDRIVARQAAVVGAEWFSDLFERIIETSVAYLVGQASAGADALQIFDTWAGDLPEFLFEDLVFAPIRRIVEEVRLAVGEIPFIGFARGLGVSYLEFARRCGLNAVSVGSSVDVGWLRDVVSPVVAVQGNLDPAVLLTGGAVLDKSVRRLLSALPPHSHIMNLGHGVHPATPVEHVARMIDIVREADTKRGG